MGTAVTIVAGGYGSATVDCPLGKVVIGGGPGSSGSNMYSTDSRPLDDNTWIVFARNAGTTSATLAAYAVCANAS